MSVSIITFANLGEKTNLKTGDILPVIDILAKKNELKQVICQINTDFYFSGTSSAIPTPFRYSMRVIEKIFHFNFSRETMEGLFDYFTALRLKRADVYIFHGGYFLPKTFRRAKSLGGIIIDIAVGAHLKVNTDLELEEFKALGITNYRGTNAQLFEKSAHSINFDYLITMSEFAKHSYLDQAFAADRIFIAYPDIDMDRFSPVEPIADSTETENIFRVLYVAYTTPIKGLHYLLDAWEKLELSHAELIIVGGLGDMPVSLKQEYNERIRHNPSIRQFPSTAEPERYYRNASIFAFPSLTEGFGRVTLEAMACGVPVITTENARGIVEEGKTGFIVPIRDANALAVKIQYIYDHPDIAQAMGREARLAVERKKLFGEAVYEIYQEIIKREQEKNL